MPGGVHLLDRSGERERNRADAGGQRIVLVDMDEVGGADGAVGGGGGVGGGTGLGGGRAGWRGGGSVGRNGGGGRAATEEVAEIGEGAAEDVGARRVGGEVAGRLVGRWRHL